MSMLLNELATQETKDDDGQDKSADTVELSIIEKNLSSLRTSEFVGVYYAFLNSGYFSFNQIQDQSDKK